MLQQRPAEPVLARVPSPKTTRTISASTTTSARRNNIDERTMQVAVAVCVEHDLAAEGPRAIRELLPADGADRSAVEDAETTEAMHAKATILPRAGHL